MQSVAEPSRELTIEVEVNVSERNPKFELQKLPFAFSFRGESRATTIGSYNIDEMLGTKLRAMFQRKKGRNLFDLYWCTHGSGRGSGGYERCARGLHALHER